MMSLNEIFFRNFLKVITALIIIISFLFILKPFYVSLIFAGIFAMAFSPLLAMIMRKWKLGRLKSLILMILGIFFLAGVPFTVFFIRGSKFISDFFSQQSFTELTFLVIEKFNFYLDKFENNGFIDIGNIKEKLVEVLDSLSGFVFNTLSNFISSVPDLILTLLIMFLSFFFFLLEEERIRSSFDRYFFFQDKKGSLFVKRLKASCREVFFSNVVTGVIQSSIVAFGSLACGIGDFYIVFVVTFVCSFIPVIGAAPMAFILAAIGFVEGKVGAGIAMCIIGAFSGVADNIIRPYLNSRGEVEVPGFIGLLAVIGGVIVLGLPGLFIGPLLASLMYGVIPIILSEYFPEQNLLKEAKIQKAVFEEKVVVEKKEETSQE